MKRCHVGVRELKSNLSACLRRVRDGEELIITERGRPIGLLSGVEKTLKEQLDEGLQSNQWAWSGRKWQPPLAKTTLKGKKHLSDLLLEDRK